MNGNQAQHEICPQIEVDMWDQEKVTEGTVSHAVRRYTSQWGLPTNNPPTKGTR